MISPPVLILGSLVVFMTALTFTGIWFAGRMVAGGDLPGDARSSVASGEDGTLLLEVANPGSEAVAVGWRFQGSPLPARFGSVTPRLVIRPARRSELRLADRGAVGVLGAVEANSRRHWSLPAPDGARRVVVILGQGSRLRMHDHLVPAA